MYAYQDAAGWYIETVDTGVGTMSDGRKTSLALNSKGYPCFSYYDENNGDLKYAYRDSTGWHIEIVDNAGWVGMFSSLDLDGNDCPHISYYEAYDYDGNLKYATVSGCSQRRNISIGRQTHQKHA